MPPISARIKSSGARLSQIEEGCPLRDVTCADDTDKVVKVLFSVETAEVGFYILSRVTALKVFIG